MPTLRYNGNEAVEAVKNNGGAFGTYGYYDA